MTVKTVPSTVRSVTIIRKLASEAGKIAVPIDESAMSMFPVHAALRLAADRGKDGWLEIYSAVAGDLAGQEVFRFDLSIQTFRERVLINNGTGL